MRLDKCKCGWNKWEIDEDTGILECGSCYCPYPEPIPKGDKLTLNNTSYLVEQSEKAESILREIRDLIKTEKENK